ncbi:hypothetical protein [Roseiarcus sp.]|uniref:hypothetical protein n=1 Tax=Roseiarcus sp. TaxID=1969460 RepID=UPI003F9A995B
MLRRAFETEILDDGVNLIGPWRSPRQMLAEQVYDDHVSIHDDATAQRLGFKGGTIEGPTHFSQFAPLGERLWGDAWFESGCLSAHYRNAAFEGEEVQAVIVKPPPGARETEIRMIKRDRAEVLRGTASVAGAEGPTALERRLAEGLPPLQDPAILADVWVGMKTARQRVRMDFDQTMGALYPFSLRRKLAVITEPSWLYDLETASENQWGLVVIPFEMLSVLFQYTARDDGFPVRGPAVGLFADQEIRLVEGPLFVAEDYELEREVVAMSASRRTESLWVRTSVMRPGSNRVVAVMLLNLASLKDSYAPYARERAAIHGHAPP